MLPGAVHGTTVLGLCMAVAMRLCTSCTSTRKGRLAGSNYYFSLCRLSWPCSSIHMLCFATGGLSASMHDRPVKRFRKINNLQVRCPAKAKRANMWALSRWCTDSLTWCLVSTQAVMLKSILRATSRLAVHVVSSWSMPPMPPVACTQVNLLLTSTDQCLILCCPGSERAF